MKHESGAPVRGRGGRCPKFQSQTLSKIAIPSMYILLLAFVRFRHPPSASVSFRGVPPKLDMWQGGGGGSQSSRATFSLKLQFPGLFCPVFLPSASVSFRGLPWKLVSAYIVQFIQHDIWEGGPEGKVPVPLFSLYFRCQCCFPNFCIRQLP